MRKTKLFNICAAVALFMVMFYGFFSINSDDRPTTATNFNYFGTPTVVTNTNTSGDLMGSWSAGANVLTSRYESGGASYQNQSGSTAYLFFCGGDVDGSGTTSNFNDRYNVNTNTWTRMANMTLNLFYNSGVCTLKDSLYVLGGMTSSAFSSAVNTLQRYDINGNTWTTRTSLPVTTAWNRLISYQDSLIYDLGGFTNGGSSGTTSVYLYNAISNTWRTATSMSAPNCGFACARNGDTIFVVAGGTGYVVGTTNAVWKGVISQSDRSQITWSSGTAYTGQSRQRFFGGSWGCKGIIVGPGSASGFNSTPECYVYFAGTWTAQPNIPGLPSNSGSASACGAFQIGNLGKWISASGLVLIPPYSIPNTSIYTDTLCAQGFQSPDMMYFKMEYNPTSTTTPNCGTTPVGNAVCNVTGATTLGPGGQFDTALIGSSTPGIANLSGIITGWNTSMPSNWTISFWLGPNQVDGNPSYLWGDPGAGSFRCFYGGAAGVGNVLLRGGFADVLITGVGGSSGVVITIVYDGANITVYKDGVLFNTFARTVTATGGSGFRVGSYNTSVVSQICGKMDEFRMYSRALPPAEVLAVYNQDLFGTCGPSVTGIKIGNNNKVPITYNLNQNYPNPFNPSTTIKFEIPKAGNVELKVFDILGREVATLMNEFKQVGNYTVEFNASDFASGVYFYKLKSGDFVSTKKMLLVK